MIALLLILIDDKWSRFLLQRRNKGMSTWKWIKWNIRLKIFCWVSMLLILIRRVEGTKFWCLWKQEKGWMLERARRDFIPLLTEYQLPFAHGCFRNSLQNDVIKWAICSEWCDEMSDLLVTTLVSACGHNSQLTVIMSAAYTWGLLPLFSTMTFFMALVFTVSCTLVF